MLGASVQTPTCNGNPINVPPSLGTCVPWAHIIDTLVVTQHSLYDLPIDAMSFSKEGLSLIFICMPPRAELVQS